MNSPTPAPQIGHPAGEVLVEARHLSVTYPGGGGAAGPPPPGGGGGP